MTTAKNQSNEHLILRQFTKQSVTFSKVPAHASEAIAQIVVNATDTKSSDKVLDVACGPGMLACAYAKTAQQVTGIDLVPAMIESAKSLQAEKKLSNMAWQVGKADALPFADHSFDVVVTRYSFHHFPDPFSVLKEMLRVCRPGGKIAVTDVFVSDNSEQAALYNHMEKLRDPSHVRALCLKELEGLFAQANLMPVQKTFYKLEMELEQQMRASFPNPGDESKIREIFQQDLTLPKIGMDVHLQGAEIHFTYPIVILTAQV